VSGGVDQDLYRYPLGVVAGIPPFNFPVMIPLWMMPLAVVAGNTFVLKPSERTPLGAVRLAELFQEAGFPPGVLNVVHGARETVEALIAAPEIQAVSFVGSGPGARPSYEVEGPQGGGGQGRGVCARHARSSPALWPARRRWRARSTRRPPAMGSVCRRWAALRTTSS